MIPVLSSWTKGAISSRVTKTTRYSDSKSHIAFLLACLIPAWLWRRRRCCRRCRGCCRPGAGIEWFDEKFAKSAESTGAFVITKAAANSGAENAVAFRLAVGIIAIRGRCGCRRCCGGSRSCCLEDCGCGGGGGGGVELVSERGCERFLRGLKRVIREINLLGRQKPTRGNPLRCKNQRLRRPLIE